MSSNPESCPKFFDYSQKSSKLLSNFQAYFKPIIDCTNPSRMTARKFQQTYGGTLISIVKQANSDLIKKSHEKNSDYLLDLMGLSLTQLSKLSSHCPDNKDDIYNLWHNFLSRMSDLGRYKEAQKQCSELIDELEKQDFNPILVNFYILISNCILQQNNKGIKGLEQAYDFLDIKCRNAVNNHKKAFDGQMMNKIYHNAFKLLMKTGKLLDNFATGNASLHEQALVIRTSSLQYLRKTRPFISSDFFAFAYSSVLGCYKIAASINSKALFNACLDSINTIKGLFVKKVEIVENDTGNKQSLGKNFSEMHDLPYETDKNFRNLIELSSLMYIKIECFKKVKQVLVGLVSRSDNVVCMLYDIKYLLEIVKANFLGKLELISDLEELSKACVDFFDCKLMSPLTLVSSELTELKDLTPKVIFQFDSLIKLLANLHTPNTIKTGMSLPIETLKLLLEVLKYTPKLIRFHEKLAIQKPCDLHIYHYAIFLNCTLVFLSTREPIYINTAYSSLVSLISNNANGLVNNSYNVSLNLMQAGEKDLAFKFAVGILEHLNGINEVSIAVIEFITKYATDSLQGTKSVKKYVFEFFDKAVKALDWEKYEKELLKIVEILVLVECIEIEHGGDVNNGFINFACEKSLQCKILEKKIESYYRKLLSKPEANLSKYLCNRIQDITKVLLWDFHVSYSPQFIHAFVSYIEILSACGTFFENESIISQIFKGISNETDATKGDQMIFVINYLIKQSKHPLLIIWKCLLLFDSMKEVDKEASDEWICGESLRKYMKIVKLLKKVSENVAEKLGCKIEKDTNDLAVDENGETGIMSLHELQGISLVVEITDLLGLYGLKVRFLNILLHVAVKNGLSNACVSCLKYRKLQTLLQTGKSFDNSLPSTPKVDTSSDTDTFFSCLWANIYYSEVIFAQGEISKSSSLLSTLSDSLTINHLASKRGQLAKSYIFHLQSTISLLNGDYTLSFHLCKQARDAIKDCSINTVTCRNLTILHSLNDICGRSFFTVFPATSWSFQSFSCVYALHFAEIYTKFSVIPNALILLTTCVRVGKMLSIPNMFIQASSKICNLLRQATIGSLQENVQQQSLHSLSPVEFIENIYTKFFSYFLSKKDQQKYAEHCSENIDYTDIKKLCTYLEPEILFELLMNLGDILQTNYYQDEISGQAAEQNYYKLSNFLLESEHKSYKTSIFISMLNRKLSFLSGRQHPDKPSLEFIEKAIDSVSCCPNFINKTLCKHEISPFLSEELCFGLMNMADILIKRNEDYTLYIEYILEKNQVQNPVILTHSHYLLARNPQLVPWKRAYHVIMSIGPAYNRQAGFDNYKNPEDLFSDIQILPDDWTVVALSIGRGSMSEGTILTRIQKSKDPVSFLISNKCCTGNENLDNYLYEFSDIMKLSMTTTGKNSGIIRQASGQWWEKREKLDERLKLFLEDLERNYMGILSTLFIGRISDKEIDRALYNAAKDLVPDVVCNCGQVWDFQVVYCLMTGFLCDLIPLDTLKAYISASVYTKHTDNIIKKLRVLKKSTPSTLTQSPVVLLISGHLLHLPWESMRILSNSYTTRGLSAKFLFSQLPNKNLSYSNTSYILNPSKDLESTQKTFENFFLSHENWTGIIANPPSEDEFASMLENKELVVYCGHSGGEQYIKGEKVRGLKIQAVTMLFGCSSGLLRSQGFFEPFGIAVQYMIGGCPGLLANLWDVTDKDIDRFALEMLKKVEQGFSIGLAISAARSACKLKYLVGSAPVWYGLPLEFHL